MSKPTQVLMQIFFLSVLACTFSRAIHAADEGVRPQNLRQADIPTLSIPWRSVAATPGKIFMSAQRGRSQEERERAAIAEFLAGNVPRFMRQLRPVFLAAHDEQGSLHKGVVWVTPDYLAIGDDQDFVRIGLSWMGAAAVAQAFDAVLPTRQIVDKIYHQAEVQLDPLPLRPRPEMVSVEYFLQHELLVNLQRGLHPLALLTSGHKKDLVLSRRILERPRRETIYGWHAGVGAPIQSLSIFHVNWYVDYSHAIRLVASTMWVDGQMRKVTEVLKEAQLSGLLTEEGPLDTQALLAACQSVPPRNLAACPSFERSDAVGEKRREAPPASHH